MVLNVTLLNYQHYKVRNMGKWNNSGKLVVSSKHFGVVTIEKQAFGLPLIMICQFTYIYCYFTVSFITKSFGGVLVV